MSKAQTVYDILDKIDAPEENRKIFFPGSTHLPEGNRDYKSKKFVANLDHKQMTLLGQEISKTYGERYTLLPLQMSYDFVHNNDNFKKMAIDYWMHNREVILEKGSIIAEPTVKEVDGGLQYDGKARKAKINDSAVFDTLVKAGLMKKPKKKVWDGGITFENGEASVRSYWASGGGCFDAYANWPSRRHGHGVAAFVKTGEKVEKKMIEVVESEYNALLEKLRESEEKSRKYDDLMKDLEAVKKHF